MVAYCENPAEPLKIQKTEDLVISPHIHTATEIVYVENGEITLTLGSLEYTLGTGDFALIMPSTLHSVSPTAKNTCVYITDCKEEIIPDIIRRFNGLRPASPVLRAANVSTTLKYSFASLTAERDKYVAFSLANLVVTIITSKLRFAEIRDGVTSNLSNRILSYLGTHFREQISLDMLADEMGVSRFHLSHLFSNKLGIGFKEYLNNLRVECAKGLLRSTDTPISEIYSSAGFENQRTFNRVFRDTTGASPRDYRLHREDFGTVAPRNDVLSIPAEETDIPEIMVPPTIIETPIVIEKVEENVKTKSGKAKAKKPSVPKVTVQENTLEPKAVPVVQDDEKPSEQPIKKKKKNNQAWFL